MYPPFVIKVLCIFFLASGAAEDDTKYIPEKAIELGYTTIIQRLSQVGLTDDLNDPESAFTLLVPTNDAILSLTPAQTADPSDLKEVLRFYVIPGEAYVSSLANEFQITTTSTEYPFARINLYYLGQATAQVVTIQCVPIDLSRADQKASNGLIQPLTSVLFPPPGHIMAYLEANWNIFSTLISILKETGSDEYVRDPGPYTFFAPTNDAFNKLPSGTLENLRNDQTALIYLLEQHVFTGTWCSAGLISGNMVTASGLEITVNKDSSGITVQNAKVIFADGSVTNGVVHHIDEVILTGN